MKKYFTFSNIIVSITVIVCIGTIFSLFSGFSNFAFTNFFNTDTLYLPSIYKDIFIDHNSIKGWHLNPSPNIFPDMIVYFLIMGITSNFLITSFIFAIIQYLFLNYLIFRLFRAINVPNSKLVASLSNLLLILFFMVSFYSNDFIFTFYIISNSYHTGAFLMALFCTILSIEYLKNNKRNTLVYLVIISILCIISDRLFIVLYSIPWLLFMGFYIRINNRKRLIRINVINILAVIAGLAAFDLLSNSRHIFIDQPHRIMEYKYIGESFKLLISQMYVYLTDGNFKSVIIILSLLTFIFMIFLSIKKLANRKKLDIKETYYILSTIFTIVVFLAPVINGNYTGYDTLRYNIYIFYLLVINSGIVLYILIQKLNFLSNKTINGIIITLIVGVLLNILFQFNYKGFIAYFNYYPKNVEYIDKISKEEELYCGLGNYWTAKVVTMFSRNGVRVYSSLNTIEPYCHVMNENWYKNDRFNFVLPDDEKQDSILNTLFNNDIKIIESGNIKLILTPEFGYNNNLKKVNILK